MSGLPDSFGRRVNRSSEMLGILPKVTQLIMGRASWPQSPHPSHSTYSLMQGLLHLAAISLLASHRASLLALPRLPFPSPVIPVFKPASSGRPSLRFITDIGQ